MLPNLCRVLGVGGLLFLGLTLAGCATLGPGKTAVALGAPLLAPGLDPSLGPRVREALARVLAGSDRFYAAADAPSVAAGQTEVVPDLDGAFVRVRFRVVDPAGAVLAGFAATVPVQGSSWAWTFQRRVAASAASDRFQPSAVAAFLSAPAVSSRDEVLLELRFLDLVRQAAPWTDAGRDPEVAAAYRNRYGRDLASALERPDLAYVEGGTGYLGNEQGESDEAPLHSVTVPGFLMARTEVTQALYASVTGNNPSLFTKTPDAPRRPVDRVGWYDAVEFCNLLSVREGLEPVYTVKARNPAKGFPVKSADVTQDRTKTGYRLPTEAEWEWAARGGVRSQSQVLSGGADPALLAWTGIADAGPGPVAEKAPNELGIYDLSGNVWEWCWDWYGRYQGNGNDPEGPSTGVMKVGRGGSWHAAPWMARVTARSFDTPGSRSGNLGFRVVRSLP